MQHKYLLIAFLMYSIFTESIAQQNVGIGTSTPNPNAILELFTDNKGFLIPRLTTAERLAIPTSGTDDTALLVYDLDEELFYYWDGTQWIGFPQATGSSNISLDFNSTTGDLSITDDAGTLTTDLSDLFSDDWHLTGNAGTDPSVNFLGTTDAEDFVIRTDNTERIRVLENGSVGIGNPAPGSRLDISGDVRIRGENVTNATFTNAGQIALKRDNGSPFISFHEDDGTRLGQVQLTNNYRMRLASEHVDGIILFETAGSNERMRITNNGNVGINTETPRGRLDVIGEGWFAPANATVGLETGTSPANGVRIVSGGKISIQRGGGISDPNLDLTRSTAGNGLFINLMVQGNTVGSISTNGTTTAYNTTSDKRLKENINPLENAISIVNNINLYSYNFKQDNDKTTQYGVLAQELKHVLPYAVSGDESKIDENGQIIPMMVDYSKLVPLLTKAIQELQNQIQHQQSEIETLKNENTQIDILTSQVKDYQHRLELLEHYIFSEVKK